MSGKTSNFSPPTLADTDKFDGTNYLEWSEAILMACRLRGARGYITGTISQPTISTTTSSTSPETIPLPPEETPWTSTNPSWEEWDVRDAWCLIAICQNVKNAVGLGLKTDGTAAEAWKSLEERYKTSTDLARVYAQRELRGARMNEGDDFATHLADLLVKHKRANAIGAKIDDADFREIILASLPPSWDNIISTLHGTTKSVDTIIMLEMHWSRVHRSGRTAAGRGTAFALNASGRSEAFNKKICTNPNCKRKGHLVSECYWPGGGKEGQFPPGFGQRGGSGTTSRPPNTLTSASSTTPTANIAATEERVFALTAQRIVGLTIDQKVSFHTEDDSDHDETSTSLDQVIDSQNGNLEMIRALIMARTANRTDICPTDSSPLDPPNTMVGNAESSSVYVVSSVPTRDIEVERALVTGENSHVPTATFADSGASNHCFVNKADFSAYEEFSEPLIGQAASRDAKFKIIGKGTVIKTYLSKGKRVKLIFTEALHTPDFAANLISISKFDAAGVIIIFGGGEASFYDANGDHLLTVKGAQGMYAFEEAENIAAMSAKSHEKPTSIDGWHLRFCHFGIRTIQDMHRKNMVDGLQILPGKLEPGKCKDCIYGKQTTRPYDKVVTPATEVLERVHMDLWGPAQVSSVGGAKYALIMTDDACSYRKEYLLASKSADATLQKIKEFKLEAELQTGKKIKCFRFDMGKEFLNELCQDFCKENGIRMETTPPYSHASNGVAERTNRTLFESVRAFRCDSRLPPSYWADILSAVTYVKSLMPSRRSPGVIPAEKWFRKRQDVSHLRRIGSTAYAKVPKEVNPSKLDSTSIKYTLIGYYGRDSYKLLDRNTGNIIKSRNVVFEEGSGNRTSFEGVQLKDEPIFEDERDDLDKPVRQDPVTMPDVTVPETPAQPPVPQPILEQAPRNVIQPQPVAPRHRPTDVTRQQRDHPQNVQLFNLRGQEAREIPSPPPRRSTRIPVPTAAAEAAAEFARREEEAREKGEDWAEDRAKAAYTSTIAIPAYNMELDVRAFQAEHLAKFQSDLSEYCALLADTDRSYAPPRSYTEAIGEPDLWLPPMQAKMDMMTKRGVFSKVTRPEGHKIIGLKWVYRFKYDAAGDITKRKARLVAQGFNQIPGIDFDQTYASVARLESMRMCLAIIAHLGLRLWQIDFVAAYLNSENKFEVYTKQAPGFITPGEEDLVYRAHKMVYGMMAGAHDWENELSGTYDGLGYYQSHADSCVRHRIINGNYTLHVTYTDDVIGGSSTADEEEKAIGELESAYDIKQIEDDEEKGRHILGMSLKRDRITGAITLSQRPYLERVIQRFGMTDCNPKYTPLPVGIDLSLKHCAKTDEDYTYMADKPYREALGSIMWAQVATRPDLSFAVNLLARYQINPGPAHWKAILHVLAYIKATLHYKITYSRGTEAGIKPYGFVDADFAGDLIDTGLSTSGHIFMMAGGPVSWSSKRQDSVAVSTTEAEYMATSRACQQSVWMYSFMHEIGLEQPLPAILYNDNTGSIALTKNRKGHKKAKHIQIRYHYIREQVGAGDITVVHVPSEENLADILTKALPRPATENQCYLIGLFD